MQGTGAGTAYMCPDCRVALLDLCCPKCGCEFERSYGFPVFLARGERLGRQREIMAAYDSIYSEHASVWQSQGRTEVLFHYLAMIVGRLSTGRLLEVGCGEGDFLAAVSACKKYGTDLSAHALARAGGRTAAELSITLCEQLPLIDEYFDVVVSIGVMEHFIDAHAATSEIFRVLKPGGHYVALIHVRQTLWQRLCQKLKQYVFPRPHPLRMARWLGDKLLNPVRQPVQNEYTRERAQDCLEASGFWLAETIHQGNARNAPLLGAHVVILICRKPDALGLPKRT